MLAYEYLITLIRVCVQESKQSNDRLVVDMHARECFAYQLLRDINDDFPLADVYFVEPIDEKSGKS